MKSIALRVRQRRLEMNYTQKGLAAKADLKLPTYRRFEQTGEISLAALLRVAFVMHALDEFNNLFSAPIYSSIEDVVDNRVNNRKRGSNNG